MNKTKKLPVSISFGEFKTKANEFLVPSPSGEKTLIGVKSGKEYKYGAISYIGIEITPIDIIDKMKTNGLIVGDEATYINTLNKYINEVYRFKISNIVQVDSNENEIFALHKVANRP